MVTSVAPQLFFPMFTSLFCYILTFGLVYVHGSFDDSSYFVKVNINIFI